MNIYSMAFKNLKKTFPFILSIWYLSPLLLQSISHLPLFLGIKLSWKKYPQTVE